ncbi:MAG: SBBP repeat-containing protein [candidate division WOR-3 bacterium]
MKGAVLISLFMFDIVYPQLWIRTYDGPADWWDKAYNLCIDQNSNIFCTGYCSVFHNGDTGSLFCTIKYDCNGNQQWVRTCGDSLYDFALAVAADSSGNAYVTGIVGEMGENDIMTVKYNPDGDIEWVRKYASSGEDWGSDIAVDREGNVYVTGYTYLGSGRHSITIKYNPQGNEEWVAIDSVAYWTVSIGLDNAGNIYVAGDGSPVRYVVMKYTPDGELLWRRGENITGYPFKLAVSPNGDVYVTGSLGVSSNDVVATVKYNTNGEEQWVRTYDGPGYDRGQTLTIDHDGNCYVAGAIAEKPGHVINFDFVTIKYSPAGDEMWIRSYTGVGGDDFPFAIGVDAQKNVYVGGYSMAPRDTVYWGDDYTLLKYDSLGNLQWEARYCGPDSISGWIYDLDIDNEGYIYTTGFVLTGTRTDYDFDWCTIKYPPSGMGIAKPQSPSVPIGQRLRVYPSPAKTVLTLWLSQSVERIEIFDVSGKLVGQTFLGKNDNGGIGNGWEVKISLKGINPGIYFLKVGKEVKKFQVVK